MKRAIYLGLCLLLAACGNKEATKHEAPAATGGNDKTVTLTDAQLKNAGLVMGKTEQKSISARLKVNGQIDVPPQNLVSVSFPLGGYLKATKLLPGMQVRKGEPIAVMEDQQYVQLQQEYLSAKARQSYLEHEYDRQRELNQSKAASDKVFQQAEAEYKSNRVSVRALAEKLRLIGINPASLTDNNISRAVHVAAPITGFVSKVNFNIGKYVNPTDVLFEIVNPEDIHLRLTIFEKDIARLKVGQVVTASPANDPAKKYDCEIILIGRDIASDRSVDVHCHFKQFDKELVPGMFMTAIVDVANTEAATLPDEAIVRYENKTYVFAEVNQHQFDMIAVETGANQDGRTQVVSPDLSGRNIVVRNAYTLLMKMKNTGE